MYFEVYTISIIINYPKILTSLKLSCPVGLFGFKNFHGFAILAGLEDGNYCLSCVLFGQKKEVLDWIKKKLD